MMKLDCKGMLRTLIIVSLMLLFVVPVGAESSTEIVVFQPDSRQVLLSGSSITISAAPYVEAGITMIPLRFFAENILKATVIWEQETGRVQIHDGTMQVLLDLPGQRVVADGNDYPLANPPTLKNGHTYVPMRLLAELFGAVVHYDSAQKTITVKLEKQLDLLPVADFYFPVTIVGGQKLQVVDQSYDPLGQRITERVWEITTYDQTVTTRDLQTTLSRPKAGQYTIALRVKNASNNWSAWTTKTLEVLPNQPPEITQMLSDKKTVAIGERVQFSYLVENEDWEEIVEIRWSYGWEDGEKHQRRREKPRAFFREGVHHVYLQVRDAYGNWSEEAALAIEVTKEIQQTEKAFKFTSPVPGELYLNSSAMNFNLLPNAKILNTKNGELTLIASNNPEKVDASGILYHDQAQGKVMLRYHHRNMLPTPIRIVAIAENTTQNPVELSISRRGLAGPSLDIMQVGQQVVVTYLNDDAFLPRERILLQPGERVVLNDTQRAAREDEVVAGLLELQTDGMLQFTVAALEESRPLSEYRSLRILPRLLTHVRGTFPEAAITMEVQASGNQMEKLIIGRSDAYQGYFLYGFENTTGSYIINNGNRGVPHTLTITAQERVGVLLNPRGTIFRGALLGLDGGITHIANAGVMVGNQEAVVLGVLEKGETRTITYLAPSGSDSPILLIFVPEEDW